jgi:hypothetical protein
LGLVPPNPISVSEGVPRDLHLVPLLLSVEKERCVFVGENTPYDFFGGAILFEIGDGSTLNPDAIDFGILYPWFSGANVAVSPVRTQSAPGRGRPGREEPVRMGAGFS